MNHFNIFTSHQTLWSIFIILTLSACFEGLEAEPACFASQGEISKEEKSIHLRYLQRSSAYCTYDTQSCLEVWTGRSKEEVVRDPEYLIEYPYLVLLQKREISANSLYSQCYIPECISPQCECETAQDCSNEKVCYGIGFLDSSSSQKTQCLDYCDENSTCFGGTPKSYCPSDHCIVQ